MDSLLQHHAGHVCFQDVHVHAKQKTFEHMHSSTATSCAGLCGFEALKFAATTLTGRGSMIDLFSMEALRGIFLT